jgi:hypothetical protein
MSQILQLWAALSLGWIIAVARACVVKSRVPIQANGADEGGIGDLIVTLHLAAANRDFF